MIKTYYVNSGRLTKDQALYVYKVLTKMNRSSVDRFFINQSCSYHYTVSGRIESALTAQETRDIFKKWVNIILEEAI